jgi:hypothetical protein
MPSLLQPPSPAAIACQHLRRPPSRVLREGGRREHIENRVFAGFDFSTDYLVGAPLTFATTNMPAPSSFSSNTFNSVVTNL